jgi:hypothetical protein
MANKTASKSGSKDWCYIPVNKGYKAKIDKEDLAKVSQYTWRVIKRPSGRLRVCTSITTKKGVRQMSLAQFLMKPPKGKMVYARRFMEELDFRKENLIICTMSERQRILPKSRRFGSSQYKGVYRVEKEKKWRAQIEVDGQHISLGLFLNETEAALAYNKAAREHFGEIAYQNLLKTPNKGRRTT